MKNRPIHENLDTSFVNLSALIKYLRRRQFDGHVRIELSGYEADIYLTAENQLKAREYDHIAGRIAEGEEALQRILIRSREPGGIINVYKTVSDAEIAAEKKIETIGVKKIEIAPENKQVKTAPVAPVKPQIVGSKSNDDANRIPPILLPVNGNGKPKARIFENKKIDFEPLETEQVQTTPKPVLPNVPFEFSNNVEARARKPELSKEDRELLLNLTGELLGAVDHSLRMANLDFASAFHKACSEISADYPFLGTLDYGKGKIYYADAQVNPKFFITGVLEALRRILDKLAKSGKFDEVYRHTVQKLLALIHQRRNAYDRFFITKPLEKILGV